MRLTIFTDYSLRVLMHVASAPEGRATIAGIAQAFDVSEHHLVKVVHHLGREGFLLNTRGRNGGLKLARPAHAISVGEVVRSTEGDDILAECFDSRSNRCAIAGACGLKGALSRAAGAFHAVLDGVHLDELVAQRPRQLVSILHRHEMML